MTLQEVFDQLTMGELSQLSIAGNAPGVLNKNSYPSLVNQINMGLERIYTRFNLKMGKLIVDLTDKSRSDYYLDSRYSTVTGQRDKHPCYIMDSKTNLFRDDILKIISVKDNLDCDYVINDWTCPDAIMTPNLKTIVLPKLIVQDLEVTSLTVEYRAEHPKIVLPLGYFDPKTVHLELPNSHLLALCYFIASRIHNPVGLANDFNVGRNYAALYEQEAQRLEQENIEVDKIGTNTKLESAGFP